MKIDPITFHYYTHRRKPSFYHCMVAMGIKSKDMPELNQAKYRPETMEWYWIEKLKDNN